MGGRPSSSRFIFAFLGDGEQKVGFDGMDGQWSSKSTVGANKVQQKHLTLEMC